MCVCVCVIQPYNACYWLVESLFFTHISPVVYCFYFYLFAARVFTWIVRLILFDGFHFIPFEKKAQFMLSACCFIMASGKSFTFLFFCIFLSGKDQLKHLFQIVLVRKNVQRHIYKYVLFIPRKNNTRTLTHNGYDIILMLWSEMRGKIGVEGNYWLFDGIPLHCVFYRLTMENKR